MRFSSHFPVSILIGLPLLFMNNLWAAEGQPMFPQEGFSNNVVSGLIGEATLIPGATAVTGYALRFQEVVRNGDQISTGEESVAEVLLENIALLTIQSQSEVQVSKEISGQTIVRLSSGHIDLATRKQSVPENESIVVETKSAKAVTKGGLFRVSVSPLLDQGTVAAFDREPRVVRTSLTAQPVTAPKVLETFHVIEGRVEVFPFHLAPSDSISISLNAGQIVRFINGRVETPSNPPAGLVDGREVCAINQHCELSGPAEELLVKKQVDQALALEQALVGAAEGEEGGEEIDEQIILATTGLFLSGASDDNPLGADFPNPEIISTTGDSTGGNENDAGGGTGTGGIGTGGPGTGGPGTGGPGTGGTGTGGPGTGGSELISGAPGVNPGGLPPPDVTPPNLITPLNPNTGQINEALVLEPVEGGFGSLFFQNSNFSADTELLLVDSGLLNEAPHKGKPPQETLFITGLKQNLAGGNLPSNKRLEGLPTGIPPTVFPRQSQALIGVEGDSRFEREKTVAGFANSPNIDPDNILGVVPAGQFGGSRPGCNASPLSCFGNILNFGLNGTHQNPEENSGVDAAIRARSPSSADPSSGATPDSRRVVLKGGVVLTSTTAHVAVNSVALFAGAVGEPAVVTMEDRVLGVLNGSIIQPINEQTTTSLLTVMNAEFKGPSVPVIDVIDSSVTTDSVVVVASTATLAQTGILDQTLFEASSPILALMGGTMITKDDFGKIVGNKGTLAANLVPGDALLRLDGSTLDVNGNLFSVSGGADFSVIGSLASLQNGSTLSINNGVLVSVGSGSSFSLTSGALVNFGPGQNTLNISNALCSGGGCFAPFAANPALQVAGNQGNFSAPVGFTPFVDVGSFTDGSVNTVNVSPGAAILEIQGTGQIQIK